MKRIQFINLLRCAILLPLLLTSCYIVPTALPPAGPGAAATYAAKTLEAQAPAKTQTAEQLSIQAQQTADRLTRQAPLPTFTPAPTRPTATPMPTNTVPGLLFSATPTPEESPLPPTSAGIASLIALTATNCRSGPGKLYPVVGYLSVDQVAIVYGRNEDSTWWYIANPDKPGEYCWVNAETTEISGDIAGVPVVLVPTLVPVLDFEAGFAGIKKCGNSEYLIFRVTNTGTETLVDAVIQIVTIQNGKTIFGPETVVIPNMSSAKDCPTGVNTIEGNERGFLAITRREAMKDGIPLRAIIEMCKAEGDEPVCLIKKVEFRL